MLDVFVLQNPVCYDDSYPPKYTVSSAIYLIPISVIPFGVNYPLARVLLYLHRRNQRIHLDSYRKPSSEEGGREGGREC